MPQYADDSTEATEVARQQAERLKRLRRALSKSAAAAAREAGVSKDVWHRMETCETRINAVVLARYGQTHQIPTEYVLSGRLVGLPEDLARVVAALEARDHAASGSPRAGNPAPPTPPPAHTPSGKNSSGRAMRREVAQ